MKNLFLFLFVSLLSLQVIAKNKKVQVPVAAADFDTQRVMIIPFNPDYYFSDANHEFTAYNEMNTRRVIDHFRYGMDLNLNARIIKSTPFFTEQILLNESDDAQRDMKEIYKNLAYEFSKPIIPIADKSKRKNILEGASDFIKRIFPKEKAKEYEDFRERLYQVKAGNINDKFMNANVQNPKMFEDLNARYKTNLYVFINQFDIKTNYQQCLDRGSKNFIREFIVHFSIYNDKGAQLYGNKVTYFTDSRSIDVDVVVDEDLSILADYISTILPSAEPEEKKEKKNLFASVGK